MARSESVVPRRITEDLAVEIVRPEVMAIVEAEQLAKQEGRRFAWAERAELIKKQFPSCRDAEWVRHFDKDPDKLAELIRDLLKIDQQVPGKSGPRPSPEFKPGIELIRRMKGEDYSTLPFDQTFAILAHGLSLTQIARKTKLSRSQVHRLLRNEAPPSAVEMEAVAGAFKKEPSFFAEWRAAYITASLVNQLEGSPEIAITLYRKLQARTARV